MPIGGKTAPCASPPWHHEVIEHQWEQRRLTFVLSVSMSHWSNSNGKCPPDQRLGGTFLRLNVDHLYRLVRSVIRDRISLSALVDSRQSQVPSEPQAFLWNV